MEKKNRKNLKENYLLRELGVFTAIIICAHLALSIFMDSNGEIHLSGYSFDLGGWSLSIIIVGWLYIIAKEAIKEIISFIKRKKHKPEENEVLRKDQL